MSSKLKSFVDFRFSQVYSKLLKFIFSNKNFKEMFWKITFDVSQIKRKSLPISSISDFALTPNLIRVLP